MLKKILAVLLAAALLCGLLTACGGKEEPPKPTEPEEDTEYEAYIELILTDWMRCISANEAMHEDLDWAISYIQAFGEQPEWGNLLSARAAIELAAKRIELREEPAWDAPEEAYDYFMDREVDVSFVQTELASFNIFRQSLLKTCEILRQHLMNDIFSRDGLPRTVDIATAEAEQNRTALTYLAYATDYLLLELNDAEWTEKVHKAMQESSPQIDAARNPALTAKEELEEAVLDMLDTLSDLETNLASLVGQSQAELDLLREYLAQGDTEAIIAMYGTIGALPTLLTDPAWELTEAFYYWTEEDGTRRYLTKKEDLAGPPEHCILEYSDVTEEEVVEYVSLLHEILGFDGRWEDGEDGYFDVYFQIGDSVVVISWEEKGAVIYMLETPVCLAPDWFIAANQA